MLELEALLAPINNRIKAISLPCNHKLDGWKVHFIFAPESLTVSIYP